MAFYEDVAQFHVVLRRLFAEIEAANPRAADLLYRSRLLIRIKCTAPITDIWINGRRRPLTINFGHARLHPNLEVELAGDTLHQILLGELTLKRAVGSGQLQVQGSVLKAKALADLFHQGQAIYPQILREEGLLQG